MFKSTSRLAFEYLEQRLPLSAQMLMDYSTAQVGLSPRGLIEFDEHVFFSTTQNEAHGLRVWRTDGTVQGTEVINELDGFEVALMKVVNEQLIAFVQHVVRPNHHGLGQYELFRYDGQRFQPVQGILRYEPYGPFVFDNFVQAEDGRSYFTTDDGGPGGASLWSTDGATATREAAFENPFRTLAASGMLVYAADSQDKDLYVWDIDAKEFRKVDIQPAPDGSMPGELTDLEGTLYFSATTISEGRELWKSDGTNGGTSIVADLQSGRANSNPTDLTSLGDTLFFRVGDGGHSSLWKVRNDSPPSQVIDQDVLGVDRVGDRIFVATSTRTGDLPVSTDLWVLTDSRAEPRLVQRFSGEIELQAINERLLVVASLEGVTQVWLEAESGQLQELVSVEAAADEIRAVESSDGDMRLLVGNQIYHTDGMSLQTRLVGQFPSQPQELIGHQDLLIYSADSDHGTVVFATSGESFEVIADTAWRSVSSTIRFVEGPLIILEEGFDRDQYDHPEDFGYQFQGQLFTSDGTTSGTDQITDEPVTLPEMEYCCTYSPTYEHIDGDVYIREWIFGRNRFERVDLDQKSVAVVSDSEELARVNAAYADRLDEMLQRPVYETLEFEGREFRFVGDDDAKYLFTHEHIVGFVGDEVRRVAYDDVGISPPILGHYQQDLGFAHLDGLVYFSAIHADSGRELWRSDGTIAGTELVIDVKPGPDGSDTYVLGSSVDAVFFSANDGVHGQEVWGYTAYQDPDINGDGLLDERDFAILAANFGRAAGDEGGDINEDGIVDFADFLLLSHAIKRDS